MKTLYKGKRITQPPWWWGIIFLACLTGIGLLIYEPSLIRPWMLMVVALLPVFVWATTMLQAPPLHLHYYAIYLTTVLVGYGLLGLFYNWRTLELQMSTIRQFSQVAILILLVVCLGDLWRSQYVTSADYGPPTAQEAAEPPSGDQF